MTSNADDRRSTALRVLPLVDLTSLGANDQPADIELLCAKAVTPHGSVASVCVWPRFVAQAAAALSGSDVRICAVANFPEGDDDVERAVADARNIVDAGGHEVDVVIPWQRLAAGASEVVEPLVAAVRSAIGPEIVLKAILETGELDDAALIMAAATQSLTGGADFLKTSTGKTERSASIEAVQVLVEAVRGAGGSPDGPGIKVSGGVSSVEQAGSYLALIDAGLGTSWVSQKTMRFGASRLLDDVTAAIGGE